MNLFNSVESTQKQFIKVIQSFLFLFNAIVRRLLETRTRSLFSEHPVLYFMVQSRTPLTTPIIDKLILLVIHHTYIQGGITFFPKSYAHLTALSLYTQCGQWGLHAIMCPPRWRTWRKRGTRESTRTSLTQATAEIIILADFTCTCS